MLLGRFEEAWRESDKIATLGARDRGLWDGLDFTGKRVLIRCLHGYGDAIQFIRYARLMQDRAESVIVQTHPQLMSLFCGVSFPDRIATWGEDLSWDQEIEVMELPRAFRTTVTTIPCETPYISVEQKYCERSRRILGQWQRPRIGLLWEGSYWNPARNIPFTELMPIFEIPGADFYSFQRGPARSEIAPLARRMKIRDLSGDSPDVVLFAADVLQMDLLITVDTMGAHLAGALGKPVWMLLPFESDWRWMLDRSDTPWYPTMRLFRQPVLGDWRRPVQQIVHELKAFVASAADPAHFAGLTA
jgi:hypothetical protein